MCVISGIAISDKPYLTRDFSFKLKSDHFFLNPPSSPYSLMAQTTEPIAVPTFKLVLGKLFAHRSNYFAHLAVLYRCSIIICPFNQIHLHPWPLSTTIFIFATLVGDGGTGKTTFVKVCSFTGCSFCAIRYWSTPSHSAIWLVNSKRSTSVRDFSAFLISICVLDPFKRAKTLHPSSDPEFILSSNPWCRSSPPPVLHQLWYHLLQRLGYCWSRKVRRPARWLLYPGSMRHHHVRCYLSHHIQERPQLASWPWTCLREHSHRSVRKQGWR